MDRTERFYTIERLIRSRGCVPFADLMDELGVSRATLKRDLEYLRSRMDAPIVYDRDSNGYRLQSDGRDPAQARHELPGLWFSEREIHALLTMHQLVQALDEGGVLGRHLQPLLDKLHGLLGAGAGEAQGLIRRIRIISPARRAVPSRHFELVGAALMQRRQVKLDYFVRSRQALTHRLVSPQRLVHWRNTWYLDAWCHEQQALRRFALDAVQGAQALDAPAHELSIAELEHALDAGYGIFTGSTVETAVLRFDAEAAQWVAQEQWHPQQRIERHEDGGLTLHLPFADATELAMDVLRHGPHVRVLQPPSLVQRVQEALRDAAAQYDAPAVPS